MKRKKQKAKVSNNNLKHNFVYSTVFQIFTMIIPFITAPYVSRVLGAEGVGIQSYTGSIQSYFLLFAALGTASYGNREISQARDKKEVYSKKFYEIELITVLTGSVCLVAWLGLILLDKKNQIYYIAMIPYIFGTMFDISWFYNGLENFKITVMCNILFKTIGIISIFAFVKDQDDLVLYILIMAVTTMLANLSMWIYLPHYVCKVNPETLQIKEHFKQTFMYFIPTIATSIYTVLDKTLIGVITQNDAENGYYEQATKIINMAKSVSFNAVNAVVGVRISYLFVENKEKEIKSRIENSMNFILFMAIGCGFGIAGIASTFVPLFFGEGYNRVVDLLYIFCPIITIIGISNCLGSQYYTPSGRRNDSTKYLLCGACVNLILNLCLIGRYGANGAAVASVFAEFCITFLYVKNCNGFMRFGKIWSFMYKKIIAGLLMFLVVINFGIYLHMAKLLVLACQVIMGIITYLVVLMIEKDKWINAMIGEVVQKLERGKQ